MCPTLEDLIVHYAILVMKGQLDEAWECRKIIWAELQDLYAAQDELASLKNVLRRAVK